jgi:hypothetical protein
MRINGIPDGGQQETTSNTTKLVTDLVKSIDPDLNESDIILASEIGRDAVKVINDINTKSSEHNIPRSSQGPTRIKEHPQLYAAATPNHAKSLY